MFMMDVPNMEVEYDEGSVNLTLWEILHSPSENPYPPKEYMIQMADKFINHCASIIKVWNQGALLFVKLKYLDRETWIVLVSIHPWKHELCWVDQQRHPCSGNHALWSSTNYQIYDWNLWSWRDEFGIPCIQLYPVCFTYPDSFYNFLAFIKDVSISVLFIRLI